MGDAMQPAAQGVGDVQRAGLAGQDEERGLKGILGVVLVAQDSKARGCDHRAMSRHQAREGRSVA